jgi:hypothetical protein
VTISLGWLPLVKDRRRGSVLVLLAAPFVYHLDQTLLQEAVCWLRHLGGKLGLSTDADDPYILLAGGSAVLLTLATILYAHHHPLRRAKDTCGQFTTSATP